MLRNIMRGIAAIVPEMTQKVGAITALGAAPGSYVVVIEGQTYNQVWSVNLLRYNIGTSVKVIMDRGQPLIVP